jgi:hypothetical protein
MSLSKHELVEARPACHAALRQAQGDTVVAALFSGQDDTKTDRYFKPFLGSPALTVLSPT